MKALIRDRNSIILLLIFGGFVITLVEARFIHAQIVFEHPIAWVPTIAAGAGAFASILALFKPAVRRLSSAVFALVALSGIVGVGVHTEFEPHRFSKLFTMEDRYVIVRANGGDEVDHESDDEPPPLAPLGLTGLAAIGFVLSANLKRCSDS